LKRTAKTEKKPRSGPQAVLMSTRLVEYVPFLRIPVIAFDGFTKESAVELLDKALMSAAGREGASEQYYKNPRGCCDGILRGFTANIDLESPVPGWRAYQVETGFRMWQLSGVRFDGVLFMVAHISSNHTRIDRYNRPYPPYGDPNIGYPGNKVLTLKVNGFPVLASHGDCWPPMVKRLNKSLFMFIYAGVEKYLSIDWHNPTTCMPERIGGPVYAFYVYVKMRKVR